MATKHKAGDFYQAWTVKAQDGTEAHYIRVGRPDPNEFGTPLVYRDGFVKLESRAQAEYLAHIMDENARFSRVGADLARHLWNRLTPEDRGAAWEAIQAFNDLTSGDSYAAPQKLISGPPEK